MLAVITRNLGWIGLALLSGGFLFWSLSNQLDWKAWVGIGGGSLLLLASLLLNLARLRRILSSRQGRQGGLAGATLLLTFGILALVNFLNFKNHKRFDLSEAQLYSISSQSAGVVESLDQDVQVTAFFSSQPQEQRRFYDLMREYRDISSRISFQAIDPVEKPNLAARYGIDRPGQAVVESGEKTETVGLTDFRRGWQADGEERITNAIIKVTSEDQKRVYFLQGHGERDIEDNSAEGFFRAAEQLRKQNYLVETLKLAQEGSIPEGADVLISVGPQINFFPNEVQLLHDYLAAGGNLLLLVDPQNDFSMNEDFLADYGLHLDGNMVLDSSGLGRVMNLGPAVPLAASYAEHPITDELDEIMTFYPRAQSLQAVESSLGYDTQGLIMTSRSSWGETELDAEQVKYDEGKDQLGPLYLAATAVKAIEPATEDAGPDQTPLPSSEPEASGEVSPQAKEDIPQSRMALFGDSDFATNRYFDRGPNGDVFLLTVNWLAQDDRQLGIRPRSESNRNINLNLTQSNLIFIILVLALPVFTLIFGVRVWLARR